MSFQKIFLTLAILSLSITGIFTVLHSQQKVLGVISPLADEVDKAQQRFVFEQQSVNQKYPPNEYFPKNLEPTFTDVFEVNAKAYAVMDRKSGELLFAKNLTQELPIASLAKIMTAIVSLEKSSLDVELVVSQNAADIGEAEMGLTVGERMTVEKLLYGLLLPSGNDAAETLAEGLGKGRSAFISAMNEKAKALGMYDSFFFNPTGLDGDTQETTSFSTALDLLALTNFSLHNDSFRKIVSTYYKEIPYEESKHKAFYLYNILQLDRSYPGIKGVKPGITEFAGETLVSYAENGGRQIIVVLLGTEHSRDEVIKMYDFLYKRLGVSIEGRA